MLPEFLADGNDLEIFKARSYLAALQKSFDLTMQDYEFRAKTFLSCMKVLQYLR